MSDPIPKPKPVLDGTTAEFYRFCQQGELRFQRCSACGTWRHPPRVLCAHCGSPRWTWERSSGRGRVFTWTVVHQAMHPAFAPEVPYAVLVVETEEGVRVVSNLRGAAPDVLELDVPVEVAFEPVPVFRLARSDHQS